jgi:DNA-binding LytR/AlgR family response regulator
MILNCAIVDDEQFSVDVITKYIALFPRLKLNAFYLNPVSALQEISAENNLDIIFLDVDMPHLSGIELARTLRRMTKKMIFTTAHSRYAFDDYEVEGDAFLLKPYSFAKFSSTVNRLFPLNQPQSVAVESTNYFLVKNKNENLRMVNVAFPDVMAFESSQNYVRIYLTNNQIITAYLTIKDILDMVKTRKEFIQVHRAYVVNTNHIGYIEKEMIKMGNKISFSVGESFRSNFTAYLKDHLIKTSR